MYCRISQRWLFSSVIDIEMGNSTIQDVCKCVDMVDSIQPTSISIDTFYKSLSFYNIKMNLKPGRRPQTQDEATIIQLISDIRKSGIIVGIKKMYTIIRRNYPNIGVSWHGIRKIYEKCEWLNAPPKRKAQPQQRCRYQAVYPNQIWHVDIHIWSKYTGLYIFGVIDDRSRFLIGLSLISKKNSASTSKELEKMFIQYGIPGAIWSDNGGENIGKKTIDLLKKYNVRLIRTSPYNPEQNGKIERLWRSLEKMTTTNLNSIEIFRNNYNNYIPHSAFKHQAPSDVYYGIRHFKPSDSFEIDELVNNQIIRKTI